MQVTKWYRQRDGCDDIHVLFVLIVARIARFLGGIEVLSGEVVRY
jgi:hypothetical protein